MAADTKEVVEEKKEEKGVFATLLSTVGAVAASVVEGMSPHYSFSILLSVICFLMSILSFFSFYHSSLLLSSYRTSALLLVLFFHSCWQLLMND